MKIIPLLLAAFGVAAVPAAIAQGCCGSAPTPAKQAAATCPHSGVSAGCGHQGHSDQHQGHATAAEKAGKTSLPKPIQAVFDNYVSAQNALAADSLENAKAAAAALEKAVRSDTDDALPPQVFQQAHALAQASDLKTFRAAFRPLSESMIKYAKSNGLTPGAYVEVYCSMAKAGWLQRDKAVKNPYYGSSMLVVRQN